LYLDDTFNDQKVRPKVFIRAVYGCEHCLQTATTESVEEARYDGSERWEIR